LTKLPEHLRKYFNLPRICGDYQYCPDCDGYGVLLNENEKLARCGPCRQSGLVQYCEHCGKRMEFGYTKCWKGACREERVAIREKAVLEKAREEGRILSLSSPEAAEQLCFYCSKIGHNNGYIWYDDLDWVLDDLEPGTYYLTSTTPCPPFISADNIIESLCENSYEEADVDGKEYTSLQKALDTWLENVQHLTTYEPDENYFFEVIIDGQDC